MDSDTQMELIDLRWINSHYLFGIVIMFEVQKKKTEREKEEQIIKKIGHT